ncbi:MAG: sialidase, partial [Deltaproteobacteria bacterium]
VEASRFDPATAYATFDRHTFGDMTPWVYRTTDYGKTWTRIAGPSQGVYGYAHTIREDAVKKDLLFLGTEFGLWISLDGGAKWAQFKGGDFPNVAVREVQVHPRDNDLVIATHGRGIWIVDDLTPLRALTADALQKSTAFLPIRDVQQRLPGRGGGGGDDASFVGEPAPNGAEITYYLRSRHVYGPIKLEVLDAANKLVDTITPSKRRGINRVSWNMRIKGPKVPRAATVANAATQGPRVPPGTYTVRLTRGSEVVETKLAIGLDRRAPYSIGDRKVQFDAVMKVHGLFGDMTKLAGRIDAAREAIHDRLKGLPAGDPLAAKLHAIDDKLEAARKEIVATKEGGAITGEERIREHLDQLYGALDRWEGRPAKYKLDRIEVLRRELGDVDKTVAAIVSKDVRALDDELKQHRLEPLPQLSSLDRGPGLDALAMQCVATAGTDCDRDAAVATEDND